MPAAAAQQPRAQPLPITRKIYTDLKKIYDPLAPGMIDQMVEEKEYEIVEKTGGNNGSNSNKN